MMVGKRAPLRLYTQLTLLVSAILAAAFLSFGWITLHGERDQQLRAMRHNAGIVASSLAESCAQYLLVEDYAGLDVFLAKSVVLPDIVTVEVSEPDGLVVSSASKGKVAPLEILDPPVQQRARLEEGRDTLVVWQPLVAGSHLGWLRVAVSLDSLNLLLSVLWRNTLLLTLLWIVASVVLMLFFMKGPVRLIQDIASFARQLDKRKGATLDLGRAPLELHQLGEAFNNASLELLNTERSLVSERERLIVTLESLGEGVIATDGGGRITLYNAMAERLVGAARSEAVGRPFSEIFVLEEAAEDPMAVALGQKRIHETTEPPVLLARDGRKRHVAITAAPILGADGGNLGAVLVFKDISAQRQAEEERRLNEERFESLFVLSQMTQASEKELTDFALEEAVRLTGSEVGYLHLYAEEEQSLRLFAWSKATRARCSATNSGHYPLAEAGIWADSIRTKQPVIHNDYAGVRDKKGNPAGQFPLLRHMSVPVFDGEKIVAVAGVGNKKEPYDQTDVRQLSLFMHNMLGILQQRQALERVRKAKEEWERTFDSIDDPVTIHDKEMRILMANKAAARLLSVPRHEMSGKHCFDIFRGSGEACPGCPEVDALADHLPHSAEVYHESLGKTFMVSCSPIFDANGQVDGFVHIAKDITERRRVEGKLRQAQKMEALGTLAGGIAHDFNNILTGIFGYTELAMATLHDPEALKEQLGVVLASAKRARELVKQILTFSRQREFMAEPLQPKVIIKEALKLLQGGLPTTIQLLQDIQSESRINADPTAIHQMVMNLCSNACQAMESTGGTLAVSLTDTELDEHFALSHPEIEPGRFVRLTVSDTGQGMGKETLARIFDPFFTTKPEGKGTGLGLSMVHGIAHSCGGTVTVYSEPGQGATFHVFLPAIVSGTEQQAGGTFTLERGNGSILFVDDEEVLLMLNRQLLEKLGYTVSTFAFPAEALAEFQRHPSGFDLVISDINMPGMNGVELARKIKEIRNDTPIILLTGFSADIAQENVAELGVQKLVMKPVLLKELAEAVRQVLGAAAGRRNRQGQ